MTDDTRECRCSTAAIVAKPESKPATFTIRQRDVVGANDADEDGPWLTECFVDTGQLQVLRDMTQPQRIVLGRTGSGKSALLKMLSAEEHVAVLEPAKLSLSYVSNSPILRVLREAEVNLEFFYKLLWRHCFCVELLRTRFPIQGTQYSWLDKIRAFLGGGSTHLRALKYLEECGDGFFDESDVRVRTLVEKVEKRLDAEIGGKLKLASAKLSTGETLSTEERTEFAVKAQKVLPDHHRQELAGIVDLVNSVLDDPQKPHYVLVDQIDENWIEDDAKYPLIMALIETLKDFKKVKNAKVIVATRVDLLRRVFDRCRSSGFQEEKYESLYLRVTWSDQLLEELANKRIAFTFRDRYSASRQLTMRDVFQNDTKYFKPVEFMLDRTLQRPRDVIAFLNACFSVSDGQSKITKHLAELAEKDYSESRLRSLRDEWGEMFPAVDALARILLDKQNEHFKVGDLSEQDIAARCVDHQVTQLRGVSPEGVLAAAHNPADARQLIRKGIAVLCHVGVLSLKLRPDEPFRSGPEVRLDQILPALNSETSVRVHRMLGRALHIRLEGR